MIALTIVIPAYNEAARLGPTLAAITAYLARRAAVTELLVVDDGSRDDTAALARAAGARVLVHAHNRGKGAAVRTGLLAARGDRVLVCDADLATPIAELARLEAALDAGADVAIASRHVATATILAAQPWPRRVLGRAFRAVVRAAFDLRVHDPMCGFKLLTRAAAHDLAARATIDRFAFDVELLALARGRYAVAEVPVTWRHISGSRFSPTRDGLGALCDLLAIRRAARGRGYFVRFWTLL
ncbi:MAG TPA: glycosyltransferase [Kofleriaceae bacterium]|nr:glycosyltransferase [Kofleriaceae bacterium]